MTPAPQPTLTLLQASAFEAIRAAILAPAEDAPPFLLHGVTGSGKTEIYLRAIELTLALGRGALFLVPEIALTTQTLQRVVTRFPGRVAVVHSGISAGEQYDTWRRARDGIVQVIVGGVIGIPLVLAVRAAYPPVDRLGQPRPWTE